MLCNLHQVEYAQEFADRAWAAGQFAIAASDIVLNVDRTNLAVFQNSLLAYQHQPVGVDCKADADARRARRHGRDAG